jgi:molybdate transport system substrate-binding protein
MNKASRLLLSTVALFGLFAAACGSDGTAAPATTAADSTTVSGEIVVFAASSLTGAFTEIGDAFTTANPDAKVTFSFAASSELVTQIDQGAPADVFASADMKNMTKLSDKSEIAGEPTVFATNMLQIMVGSGNPKGIAGVEDLANQDLIVVACDPEVPCGKYTTQLFTNAGVTVTPKSLEQNVKAVVTKVTSGEADAGIVYITDVLAAGDKAAGVDIPADVNVKAEYPIGVTAAAPNASGARAFVDFVNSAEGRKILTSFGFGAP